MGGFTAKLFDGKKRKDLRAYESWKHMRSRCMSPSNIDYEYYGARGVKICQAWLDFSAFYADMGERPNGFTLERTNVDGNYEPSNCIWVPQTMQSNNRRSNYSFEYMGKTLTLADISKMTGICWNTLKDRVKRGWSIEKIMETPLLR